MKELIVQGLLTIYLVSLLPVATVLFILNCSYSSSYSILGSCNHNFTGYSSKKMLFPTIVLVVGAIISFPILMIYTFNIRFIWTNSIENWKTKFGSLFPTIFFAICQLCWVIPFTMELLSIQLLYAVIHWLLYSILICSYIYLLSNNKQTGMLFY